LSDFDCEDTDSGNLAGSNEDKSSSFGLCLPISRVGWTGKIFFESLSEVGEGEEEWLGEEVIVVDP
jgi:hypothetical protein